jgi:hypothetical protein
MANSMEEGPTKTTWIPFPCASFTITAPGSATQDNQLRSLIPCFYLPVRVWWNQDSLLRCVCLNKTNSDCFFGLPFLLIFAVLSFSQCNDQWNQWSLTCGKTSIGSQSPIVVGIRYSFPNELFGFIEIDFCLWSNLEMQRTALMR